MKKFVMLFAVVIFCLTSCQSQTKEDQIKKITENFKDVEANIDSYERKDILYEDPENHWMNANYTAYISKEKVVKLVEETGEEGYGSTISFYYKDEKIFFIFLQSVDPDENEDEKRIYFHDEKIIDALMKNKAEGETREFSKIKNTPDENILKDLTKSTKVYLEMAKTALSQYKTAVAGSK